MTTKCFLEYLHVKQMIIKHKDINRIRTTNGERRSARMASARWQIARWLIRIFEPSEIDRHHIPFYVLPAQKESPNQDLIHRDRIQPHVHTRHTTHDTACHAPQ